MNGSNIIPVTDRLVILTGAGMPAAWGGLLAKDIGSLLWSHLASKGIPTNYFYQKDGQHAYSPQKSPRSYEDVLADVPTHLLEHYLESLRHIFDFHQSLVECPSDHSPGRSKFCEMIGQLGFKNTELFTLNQDNTIEHLSSFSGPASPIVQQDELGDQLPVGGDNLLPIIHLHGKMDWTDSHGRPVIITGSGVQKWNQIQRNDEIRKRWDRFDESLRVSDCVLVIGYSFLDKHVNKYLAKHADRERNPIVIIGTSPFGEWINSIHPSLVSDNKMILDRFFASIRGYYSSGLADCLPKGRLWDQFYKSVNEIRQNRA